MTGPNTGTNAISVSELLTSQCSLERHRPKTSQIATAVDAMVAVTRIGSNFTGLPKPLTLELSGHINREAIDWSA